MEEKLYVKNENIIGDAFTNLPANITIENCEHIYLTQKGIDVKVDVHIDDFDKIKEIIINGRKFKKVKL